jgi:hypothetical protein
MKEKKTDKPTSSGQDAFLASRPIQHHRFSPSAKKPKRIQKSIVAVDATAEGGAPREPNVVRARHVVGSSRGEGSAGRQRQEVGAGQGRAHHRLSAFFLLHF